MFDGVGIKLLLNDESRKMLRTFSLATYFLLFQILILLQKPFLQIDFIFSFYSAFSVLFLHHFILYFYENKKALKDYALLSYGLDFFILIMFMKSFPQLSSFLLVIQLLLMFLASFDLKFVQLCGLGLLASLGISIMNLSLFHNSSMQNILSLVLFNLSYIAVIIVSGQLKSEIYGIQSDLSKAQKKSKSQEEFSKILLEKIPLGLVISQDNDKVIMQNNFINDSLNLSSTDIKCLIDQAPTSFANDINHTTEIRQEKKNISSR